MLEPLAADPPRLAMSVDLQIGEACAVGCMEKIGLSGQADQDIGLLRTAPARVAVLLCEGLSSAVTRQPASLSRARRVSNAARSVFLSAARRSRTSGAKAAPGSVAALSTKPSSGSRISSPRRWQRPTCVGFEVERCRRSSYHARLVLAARAQKHVVEVHSLWRMSDAHAAPFALPAQRRTLRRCLARVIPIGQNDHIAHARGGRSGAR